MSASEVETVRRQHRERVEVLLAPEELALYDAYQGRIEDTMARHSLDPVKATPAEQAVLDKLANDMQVAALHKQLMVLLRIETLPQ